MAILIDKDTKVLVQGITGHQGRFHSKAMIDLGTKVVAGVTPGLCLQQQYLLLSLLQIYL